MEPPPSLLDMMGVWATLTGMVGFLANGAAICLFCRSSKLRTPFNWVLMNLSLTELIIASSGNSVLAFNSFHRRWTLSNFACQANAFGMTYLGIQSIVTLSVLALQRYMMVTKDRQFPLSTPLSTLLTLIFIWTYTFLVCIPPILGWGSFNRNNLHVSCGVKWDGSGEDPMTHMAYVFYIYVFGFILPVSIIFSSYFKIIKTIKLQATVRASTSISWRSPGVMNRVEKDRKLTIMVAVMIVSFLVTWFPYACVSIAETAGYIPQTTLSFYILAIPTMLTKTAVCIDPIIYFGLNPQFQSEMFLWLGLASPKTRDDSGNRIVMTRLIGWRNRQTSLLLENSIDGSEPNSKCVVTTSLETSTIKEEEETMDRVKVKKKIHRVKKTLLRKPSKIGTEMVQSDKELRERKDLEEGKVEMSVKEGKVIFTKKSNSKEQEHLLKLVMKNNVNC